MVTVASILFRLLCDASTYVRLLLQPNDTVAAENLFLRKLLALYQERNIPRKPTDPATRFTMAWLAKRFNWRDALIVVQPRTLIRWHRLGFRLFWRYKSRPGRPRIPLELRQLIWEMALDNVCWGEERIANELLLKLGIQVSPRTVRKYMPKRPEQGPRGDQRWQTFLQNHAHAIVACDFCVVVTATFRLLYVLVVIEHKSRRLVHCNVTQHPTAEWTRQQFREAIPSDHQYRYLIHDRDRIFSNGFDRSIENFGMHVLKTPYRSPKANSICERAIGSMRRECLDYMIPITESQLRRILKSWSTYYNQSRPHTALGPGLPDRPDNIRVSTHAERHRIRENLRVITKSVLGGLHHDYELA
ncbi:MAG: integrase core domain-containing protein, partial [Gammaproteobacteria bacterium]|nr:integrase core domain-containing protein [Gammaproteobacteria bacterium]